MKTETLEEAAERLSELQEGTYMPQHKITYKHGFTDGAKWQQEIMYSVEEVLDIIKSRENYLNNSPKNSLYINVKEWFEKYKKK